MFSYGNETNKGTAAYESATAMPVILENGRKVFGPPPNYAGTRPSYLCELYVTRIPQHLDELSFLVWLHRIGAVYEFRLMMDTGNSTRGYAFIRFCSEKEALAAFELLKYLFVSDERLSVFRSLGKKRLYISGIPRHIPITCLDDSFKLCFPKMKSCTAYPALKANKFIHGREDELNRGFAFIEFFDHEMALAAKKRLTPGRIRMWGVDLKVQWAKPKEERQLSLSPHKQNNGPMSSRIYPDLNPMNDYCAKLRLYCLANNLCIPVVVYGPSSRIFELQYAGILLKNNFTGFYSYFIFEIVMSQISDIHLLICELTVKMIEKHSSQLKHHVLFRVTTDTHAELVYTFKNCDELKYFNLQKHFRNTKVIMELAISMQILALHNSEKLLELYKRAFLTHRSLANFCLDIENPLTQFCAILPKFRNNTKLNNNFNDLEITLLQIQPQQPMTMQQQQTVSLSLQQQQPLAYRTLFNGEADHVTTAAIMMQQQQQPQYHPHPHHHHYHESKIQKMECFTLKSQRGFGIKYILRYVDIIGVQQRKCYHLAQRVNSNPIWISGQSYQKSIYN